MTRVFRRRVKGHDKWVVIVQRRSLVWVRCVKDDDGWVVSMRGQSLDGRSRVGASWFGTHEEAQAFVEFVIENREELLKREALVRDYLLGRTTVALAESAESTSATSEDTVSMQGITIGDDQVREMACQREEGWRSAKRWAEIVTLAEEKIETRRTLSERLMRDKVVLMVRERSFVWGRPLRTRREAEAIVEYLSALPEHHDVEWTIEDRRGDAPSGRHGGVG